MTYICDYNCPFVHGIADNLFEDQSKKGSILLFHQRQHDSPPLTLHHPGLTHTQSSVPTLTVQQEALLLGLIAREHVYIEGPPGVAKTMLAEVTSAATDLDLFFYQLHRDTRLAELIGEAVITRERDEGSGGEVIRQTNRRGGILTNEICVLDDISRAPGEALNVLLRILNERRFDGAVLPLLTAIATGNPVTDDYYTEALDPATLDRFTIQLRTTGLVSAERWDEAMQLVDLYSDPATYLRDGDSEKGKEESGIRSGNAGGEEEEVGDRDHPLYVAPDHRVRRDLLDAASELLPYIDIPGDVRRYLLTFLYVLQSDHGLNETNSLLTDRAFLVKSLKILRAKAIVDGRSSVSPLDLFALQHLTTFRVPEPVHEMVRGLLFSSFLRNEYGLCLHAT